MEVCKYYRDSHCLGTKEYDVVSCEGNLEKCPTNKNTKIDMVSHPPHYNAGGIECIDALAAATTSLTGIEAVCTANAIKYLWRWKLKNGIEDLDKAIWYINHLKEELGKQKQLQQKKN